VDALGLDHAIRIRGAQLFTPVPGGAVIRHDGLPSVYHLNTLLLDAPLPTAIDAPTIVQLADEWLGDLGHRRVVLDDPEAAQRVEPQLAQAGWSRQRTVFMVWRGEPEPARDDRAAETTEQRLRAIQGKLLAEERPGDPSLVAVLVEAQAALRAGTSARGFIAADGGEPASSCTLFVDEGQGAAMIEEVGTLIAHRERGLATAVVSCAMRAAIAAGLDPIVIPADADDWPQLLYAKLGFEPVAMQVSFTLVRR
jgi:hypothetical protein